MPERSDGATNPRDDQRGPWLLALGALGVGVLAFLVTGVRSAVRRFRSRGEDHHPERRQ